MAEIEDQAEPEIGKEPASEIGKEAEAHMTEAATEIPADVRTEAAESFGFQRLDEDASAPAAPSVLESIRAIVGEAGDYSRRSLENGSTFLQKLVGAASFENVIQIQSEYARISYVGLVAHVMKLGQLYSNFARLAFKPVEGKIAKASTGNG